MLKLVDLAEGKCHIKLMINNVTNGLTNKGVPYLSLNLQDSSCAMDAKYWDVNPELINYYQPGMVVLVDGDVISYNNALQLRVRNLEVVDINNERIEDYVASSPIAREELEQKVNAYIDGMANENLKKIVQTLINNYRDKFFVYPAASSIHHNFVGGLATHVLGMLELAEFLAHQYPLLNADLLYSGVILHDLGKVKELSGPVATNYTVEGKLLGHISIMQAEIYEISQQLGLADSEESILLRHLILSHHGEYEYGSPVKPMCPEAEILTYIDNIDAKMNVMEKNLKNVEEGSFSSKIFALDGRCFYNKRF